MRELHLFAGIGGGILSGKLLGHRCVGAVEINAYCRQVLKARQREGILESFPIHEDVCTFDGKPWRGKVDVVCGGFPCQPWSTAGKRLGTADPRHLWPEMARIIAEVRPAYVFAENVSLAAFEQPWRDLRGMGYRVPPALQLGAVHVGAPHRRLRWWLLAADASSGGLERSSDSHAMHCISSRQRASEPFRMGGGVAALADACGAGLAAPEQGGQGRGGPSRGDDEREAVAQRGWWTVEPRVGRVAHGVPARVDRLKALGNAQVPAVAAAAFRILLEREMSSR